MKIIEPKVELWQQGDDSKAHVARCTRVCYGRETGNDEAELFNNDNNADGTPHPNCIIIAGMIKNNLMELGYDFRD